jgi:hypothetical protein
MALIDSFAYAKSALDKAQHLEEIDDLSFTEMIYQLKSSQEDFKCAARIVAAYADNKDKTIAASADLAKAIFDGLIRLDDDLVNLTKSVLDNTGKPNWSEGEFAEKLAEIRVAIDETWKALAGAAVLATYVLVQMPAGKEEKLSSLRIKSQDRKSLLQKLEREFGPAVQSGLKGGQHALLVSAALLYQFLSNSAWKSSDSN